MDTNGSAPIATLAAFDVDITTPLDELNRL